MVIIIVLMISLGTYDYIAFVLLEINFILYFQWYTLIYYMHQ